MTTEVQPVSRERKQTETPIQPVQPQHALPDSESRIYVASQYTLMWRKFRKHRLAMLGGVVTIAIYLVVVFAEFLAPFPSAAFSSQYTYAPPQPLHLFDETPEGRRFSPHVNGYKVEVDQVALRRTFVVDPDQKVPVSFFTHGTPYKLWGLINLVCWHREFPQVSMS